MSTTKSKKKPYLAWWALPFIFQETNHQRPIRTLMLGFHKPSKLGAPARPDITFLKEPNVQESIPFPGNDLAKLASGVIVCSAMNDITKKAELVAKMASARRDIYREFNSNEIDFVDIVRLSTKHGEHWEVPVQTRLSDVRILKGAFSYDLRKGHNTTVHSLIAVGKDIRHNIPVLVFKKSWRNFTDAMWLWDGGVRFLAGLFFLVKYPPKGSRITFLSDHELDVGTRSWTTHLSEQVFVPVDQMASVTEVIEVVKTDQWAP